MLFGVVRAGGRLKKSANGEESQEGSRKDCATRIVLVGRLDIAMDDTGSTYLVKNGLPV